MRLLTKRHLSNEQQSTFVRQPSNRGIRIPDAVSHGRLGRGGCPTSITEIGMLPGIAFCSRSTLIYGVIKLQRRPTSSLDTSPSLTMAETITARSHAMK